MHRLFRKSKNITWLKLEEEKSGYIFMWKQELVRNCEEFDEQQEKLKKSIRDLEQKAAREIVSLSRKNPYPTPKESAKIWKY